jgi:hypothetical protein
MVLGSFISAPALRGHRRIPPNETKRRIRRKAFGCTRVRESIRARLHRPQDELESGDKRHPNDWQRWAKDQSFQRVSFIALRLRERAFNRKSDLVRLDRIEMHLIVQDAFERSQDKKFDVGHF